MCDDCPAEPAAEVRVSGLLLPHLQVEIDTFLHTTSVVTASTVGTGTVVTTAYNMDSDKTKILSFSIQQIAS